MCHFSSFSIDIYFLWHHCFFLQIKFTLPIHLTNVFILVITTLFCTFRYEGEVPTVTSFTKLHLTTITESGDVPLWLVLLGLKGEVKMGHRAALFIGSNRHGIVIGCCLQVIHSFPARLCRRSWGRILRRMLDAFPNLRFSDILSWKNGLPMFTPDGCLESKRIKRSTNQ